MKMHKYRESNPATSLLVFYTFFITQIYHKLIVSQKVGLPPLKVEVAFRGQK